MRGIAAATGLGDGRVGNVGGQDRYVPGGEVGDRLAEDHRQAVRFLPRAACGRPEPQFPFRARRCGAGVDQVGQDPVLQGVERAGIAEEKRFLRGDGIDDLLLQRAVARRPGPLAKLSIRCAAPFASKLPQAALDQVALAVVENHPAELTDEFGHEADVFAELLARRAP